MLVHPQSTISNWLKNNLPSYYIYVLDPLRPLAQLLPHGTVRIIPNNTSIDDGLKWNLADLQSDGACNLGRYWAVLQQFISTQAFNVALLHYPGLGLALGAALHGYLRLK